jgi:protein SMG7
MSSIGWGVNGEQTVIPCIAPRYEFMQPLEVPASSCWANNDAPHVGPHNTISAFPDVGSVPRPSASMVPYFSIPDYSKLLNEQEMLLMNGLSNVNIAGNGYLEQRVHDQMKVIGETIPSMLDLVLPSVAPSDAISLKFTEAPLVVSKNSVI